MTRFICLNDTQLQLTTSDLDNIIQRYIFPIQFIFGVIGNLVNLTVLLSKKMQSETNCLLSAMAFADLSLLFCMLPHCAASFTVAYRSYMFRYIYYASKRQINAFANLFSAAATWLVLAVSIERFMGLRSPIRARFRWKEGRARNSIIIIFIGAFVVTFYHHIAYKYVVYGVCNGTQLRGNVMPVAYNWTGDILFGKLVMSYIKFSKCLQLLLVVLMPITAVAFLNVSLICFMRNRDVLNLDGQRERSVAESTVRQEKRVTRAVLSIITCFTVTHAPSLIPFVWEIRGIPSNNPRPFLVTISIANSLVITGKVLNFILFCLSSVYFRRRISTIVLSHFMGAGKSEDITKTMLLAG